MNKVNKRFSEKSHIIHGAPQGSILCPLLFNNDLIDLFYECEEINIASYADDTSPYSCAANITVISDLHVISSKLFHWFAYNHLKANPGKCHLLLSSTAPADLTIGDTSITKSTKETSVGIIIDSDHSFDVQVYSLCSKATKGINMQLHALGSSMIAFEKQRKLIKVFIESQFNYCLLIWMLHSRKANNKINRIQSFKVGLFRLCLLF